MKYIITEKQYKFISESLNNHIGKVYFNDDKHPGFMYVKEILPEYQMYWINVETDESIPTILKKDDMDIYWLTSPDGMEFGLEIFEKNGYLILDFIDPNDMEKYLRNGGEWFPSDYDTLN